MFDGNLRKNGSVALLRHVKNPIQLAKYILQYTPHNFIAGKKAEDIAHRAGITLVNKKYFFTEFRWRQHMSEDEDEFKYEGPIREEEFEGLSKGTVGAVALDSSGHLAAATSTGGLNNKWDGRIGDTALPGAGSWADDDTCALSCTGDGDVI